MSTTVSPIAAIVKQIKGKIVGACVRVVAGRWRSRRRTLEHRRITLLVGTYMAIVLAEAIAVIVPIVMATHMTIGKVLPKAMVSG